MTAMHDRPGIHNELVVAYTVLPGSTPACRLIEVRERDAAVFKVEFPDFMRVPWKGALHPRVDGGEGGSLVLRPPAMTIGHQVAGIHKKQWRVNDRKLLTEAGRAALDRPGAQDWRRGKPPGRDTVVWSLDYRCGGTASCRPAAAGLLRCCVTKAEGRTCVHHVPMSNAACADRGACSACAAGTSGVMPACRTNHVSWFAHAPWPAARRQHAIAIPAHTDP